MAIPFDASNPHVDYEAAYNQAKQLAGRTLAINARVLKHNETLAAENADLREELAALRHNRQLGIFDLTAVKMENGVDLFIGVHDEKHLKGVEDAARLYGDKLRNRGLDCDIVIVPPGVTVSASQRLSSLPLPSSNCDLSTDCCRDSLTEPCNVTLIETPSCSHCGQPECQPHVEGCPEMTLDAMQDDCPSAFETGKKWANALMGIDPAPGKDHTVKAVLDERGNLIATGPCCDGACDNNPAQPADSYCPACGGWGDHRIGCPNK